MYSLFYSSLSLYLKVGDLFCSNRTLVGALKADLKQGLLNLFITPGKLYSEEFTPSTLHPKSMESKH